MIANDGLGWRSISILVHSRTPIMDVQPRPDMSASSQLCVHWLALRGKSPGNARHRTPTTAGSSAILWDDQN